MADATGRPPGPSSSQPRWPARGAMVAQLDSIQRRPADRVELLGDYTELVWPALTGPTAVLLAGRLARLGAELPATGVDVDLVEMAAQLGVGQRRLHAAIERLVAYGLLAHTRRGIAVSGYGPLLSEFHLSHSLASTVAEHRQLAPEDLL